MLPVIYWPLHFGIWGSAVIWSSACMYECIGTRTVNPHQRHVPHTLSVFWWHCNLTYRRGGQEQSVPVDTRFFPVGMTNQGRLFCKPSLLPLRVAKITSSSRIVQYWMPLLNINLFASARNEVKPVTKVLFLRWATAYSPCGIKKPTF